MTAFLACSALPVIPVFLASSDFRGFAAVAVPANIGADGGAAERGNVGAPAGASATCINRPEITLSLLARLETGFFDLGAAEIAAFHSGSKRLFVVNGAEGVDFIDVTVPSSPSRVACRRLRSPTSVAVHGECVAVAHLGTSPNARGWVRFYTPDAREIGRV